MTITMRNGDKVEDEDEGRSERGRWGNRSDNRFERVANARIVGVLVNCRNKSVFYDFTDSDRKSEGLWITSGNSRLSRDSRSRCETWMDTEIFVIVLLLSADPPTYNIQHLSFVFTINCWDYGKSFRMQIFFRKIKIHSFARQLRTRY